MHLPNLIIDLALILMAATVMTLLFRWLRQPVVLGYILAGFLVGPKVNWIPNVIEIESVKVWAEIGVIFLLFALGLEFSFKKLVRIGPASSITAIVEMTSMFGIGYSLGRVFGWQFMDSLFLGGILAISSTTIIIRAIDELGYKTRGFVKLVFGLLIMEDLAAVILMVVLSTMAMSRQFSGLQIGIVALKLAFFLILWFLLGVFLVPTFFKKMRQYMSEETLLISALGLCFLMVAASGSVGFSSALGAFIMGSILAETVEGERIHHLIDPVKNLFSAIFFVSVGMLIDPSVLSNYALPIAIITLALLFGKIFAITIGALLSGQGLRHSVQTGMTLAQIGEFSFILASIGSNLKVTSEFLYPIAISVSAITTFTTPYFIRSADRVVAELEHRLPPSWLKAMERFRRDTVSVSRSDDWRAMTRRALINIGANSVIVIGVFLLVGKFIDPKLQEYLNGAEWSKLISLSLALVVSSPFLWGIAFGKINDAETTLWQSSVYRRPLLVFEGARWFFAISLVGFMAVHFVASKVVLTIVIASLAALLFFISRHLGQVYQSLQDHFVGNLNEKEKLDQVRSLPAIAPWDSHMVELTLSPHSNLAGKTLGQGFIREKFGVTVAMIERGRGLITAPGRDQVLFPGDRLQVIGTDEQIQNFKLECAPLETNEPIPERIDYALQAIVIEPGMTFAHKSIRESGLRELTQGLVVGMEKAGKKILNPDSSMEIEPGDILWIAGNRQLLERFR